MKTLLQYLFSGHTLTKSEAQMALTDITSGHQNDAQVAAFLTVYNMRMPTTDEMTGFREAMLSLAMPVQFSVKRTLDIVGTGGDGKDTFNISTLSCLVCAGAGVPVTKHGNYSVSSVSGSSNVLEYLGVRFSSDIDQLNMQLKKANITFLHAPLFHPAMKNMAQVRQQLQMRTLFNLLGPLVNPARPYASVIGVYQSAIAKLYKEVLRQSKDPFAIIHSLDGYDEISLTNDTEVFTPHNHYLMTPHAFGFDKIRPDSIHGGDSVDSNAEIFMQVLLGKGTPEQQQVVLANAGMGIAVFKQIDIKQGVELARASLLEGKALHCLETLKSLAV